MTSSLFDLEPSWKKNLQDELNQPYIEELTEFLRVEQSKGVPIYPPQDQIFSALWKTPFDKVKVVIVGQDPYHGPGQAHGLCFSVNKGVPQPPSLKNILKELQEDVGISIPSHGCLERWAEQGVLMLNATLTVTESSPMSHHNRGWERLTDAIIRSLCLRKKPVVFLLWGKNAQDKCVNLPELTANSAHICVLKAAHPSPFSSYRGFFGCRHFSKANEYLLSQGQSPIDWRVL